MIGHINFEMKQAGKPSAGNPHAGFDVAGAEDRLTVWLPRNYLQRLGESVVYAAGFCSMGTSS